MSVFDGIIMIRINHNFPCSYIFCCSDALPRSIPRIFQSVQNNYSISNLESVSGIAVSDDQIFVVFSGSNVVNILDYALKSWKSLALNEVEDPWDITYSDPFVYIGEKSLNRVRKVLFHPSRPSSTRVDTFPVQGFPVALSTTNSGNIIVVCKSSEEIREYSPMGRIVVQIPLPGSVISPCHAIRTGDRYLISHQGDLHRVCLVDSEGNLKESYGSSPGSGVGQLDHPQHLAQVAKGFILVLELCGFTRFTILNADLKFVRYAERFSFVDGICERFCVDLIRERILVADKTNACIDIYPVCRSILSQGIYY